MPAPLKDYLDNNGISQSEFARRMNVSRAAVSFWVRRQRMPKPEQMKRIKLVTRGAVTPDDWLQDIEISFQDDDYQWD